jgi:RimJ/RimL family protein N-acetyltransferase
VRVVGVDGDNPSVVTRGSERGEQPTLTGERVLLRPWRADDVAAVLAACQDPEIQRWTQIPVPYGRADAEGFVTGMAPSTWADGGALFAVEARGDGALVGSTGLFYPRDGLAEAGYWSAPGHRGRGFTVEALLVLCAWAFDEVGLRRVELHVDPDNTGSRGVAERAGFRAEGLLRQRFLHRGQPSDMLLYSLLATDPHPSRDARSASTPS